MTLPARAQIAALLKARLHAAAVKRVRWQTLAASAAGLSYAEVTRAADEVLKDALIRERDLVAGAGYPLDAKGTPGHRQEAGGDQGVAERRGRDVANGADRQSRHFILQGFTETEAYRSPQRGGSSPLIRERDRAGHGGALQRQVEAVRVHADAVRDAQLAAGMDEGLGLQVEFESFPDIELAVESLARERSGIELLNVRHVGDRIHATVLVPDGKLDHFERPHPRLPGGEDAIVSAAHAITEGSSMRLHRFEWRASGRYGTDADARFPTEDEGALWWEVWLPVRGDRQALLASFRERAAAQGMRVAPGELVFPERTVLLVSSSLEQMQGSILTLNSIAELRRAKETAEFFGSLRPEEQLEWLDELLARTQFPAAADEVPRVCLLDTGVKPRPFTSGPRTRSRRSAHGRARLGQRRRSWPRDTDGRRGARRRLDTASRWRGSSGARSPSGIGQAAAGARDRWRPAAPRIRDGGGRGAPGDCGSEEASGIRHGRYGSGRPRPGPPVGVVRRRGLAGGGCRCGR